MTVFMPILTPLNDITAIAINTTDNDKPTLIVNIYNLQDKDLITPMQEYLRTHLRLRKYSNIIIAGDFNLHSPLWNPTGYDRHDRQADHLVTMMAEHGLRPLLPPGTITFPRAGTAIDLVWGNEKAEKAITKCKIAEDNDQASDHLPIEIHLDTQSHQEDQTPPTFNYAKTDWKLLETLISRHVPTIPIDPNSATPTSIDKYTREIASAIQQAIKESTPRKRPCPFSKRWWSNNLTELRRAAQRLRRTYKRTRNEVDHQTWRAKVSEYEHKIDKAKRKTWTEFVSLADEKTIWQVKRYLSSTTDTNT